MARFTSRKLYLSAALLLFFLFAFFAPVFIEVYYPAAAPVAAALVWFTDAIGRGFAAAAFLSILATLAFLVRDVRRRITGTAPTPTPAALEAGVVDPTADSDASTTDAPEPSLKQKLLSTAILSYFLVRQCLHDDVLSRARSPLENALSALVYLFHGLEVLFALFLLLVCFVVVFRRSLAAGAADADVVPTAATEPEAEAVEVLFDDGAKGEEVLVQMEEKA